MTYAGARGQTADEMAKVMHFPRDQETMHPAYAALLKEIHSGQGRDYRLDTANALWGQKGLEFKTEFLNITRTCYGAQLQEVDFARATEKARQTINSWVDKQTEHKIPELVAKGDLSEQTRLVLTNAVYFKGDWVKKFKKTQTRNEDFWIKAGEKVSVPMMSQTGEFSYAEREGVQVLQLPYAGKKLSLAVLLPSQKDGLPALERSFTAERLENWLGGLIREPVVAALPRFKMISEFSLKQQLQSLGMKRAFAVGEADFSGMTADSSLTISTVIHKAFVEVNEEGTEAAAATKTEAKSEGQRKPFRSFRADHPFLFVLWDSRSGTILFLGRLIDPR